jgi:hypothetical protein
MKTCINCKKELDSIYYHKDKSKKDGLVSTCKSCKKEYRKKYYQDNSERLKEYSKSWHHDNKNKNIEDVRVRARIASSVYRERNREKVRQKNAEWMINEYRRKYKSDQEYTARRVVRRVLNNALRNLGSEKQCSTWDSLGYDVQKFRSRMESLFVSNMSWANHGEWHVDHIKPVSAFIKEGITDPRIINALDNLQPLWAEDNLSKGAKYDPS